MLGQIRAWNQWLRKIDWQGRVTDEVRELTLALAGCHSLLDLGCGDSSPVKTLVGKFRVGVDCFSQSVAAATNRQTHEKVICADVIEFLKGCGDRSFDAVVALDLIEHMTKEGGAELLLEMERVALRRVVIATPNGFLEQESTENPYQRHLSGWTADEMVAHGFRVVGLYGLKRLRGQFHELSSQPLLVTLPLALMSRVYARRFPQSAAGLMCVKLLLT